MKLSVCLFQSLVFLVIKSTDFDEKNFWLYNTIHQGKIGILFNFEKGWLILSSLMSQKLTKISRKKRSPDDQVKASILVVLYISVLLNSRAPNACQFHSGLTIYTEVGWWSTGWRFDYQSYLWSNFCILSPI